MPTAQQITDIKRQLRSLEPTGVLATEYIDNLVAILEAGQEETIASITTAKVFNADTVLADLTGLESGTLSINSKYVLEVILRITATSITPGAKVKFVLPAGATIAWELGAAADIANTENVEATEGVLATIVGTGIVTIRGVVSIGGTAGTVKVQGAQSVSNASDVTYEIESNLVLTKL